MLAHAGYRRARTFFTPANAQSYDRLARSATFGRDMAWKRQIVRAIGNANPVLELACGTGILSSMLASAGRNVVGLDLTFEYLRATQRKLELPLAQGTAEVLPYRDSSFGGMVSSYLAKYVDIDRLTDECWRVLRPGGVAVFHDFAYPSDPAVQGLWNLYFSILRLCGKFASSWKIVFEQLDDVIRESRWESRIQASLHSRGFTKICCNYHTFGTASIVRAEKP